jgi:transposase InsO family protein
MASVGCPSTIGKVEAFHKAYDQEAPMFKTHQELIHYCNYQRPHLGIGYLYPADICFGGLKGHVEG